SAVSSVYETDPVGCPPGDPLYYNIVVKGETGLTPLALLAHCQTVENILGRERPYHNAPRTVDVDILLMEGVTLSGPELTLPHPRMWRRGFVLVPLAELCPGKRIFGYDFAEALEKADAQPVIKTGERIIVR
ncbi:MAG: 2-amino-4-hydroxy-6-hydroxymethyldihydropteridine diphosphokinase, partial [Oscillospiraceae bacterium]|nr:2-amino-4-hydroxy-6-hydroxymethyldihydropteridine diphosphokinase [Oscillospiraceae bacterium]